MSKQKATPNSKGEEVDLTEPELIKTEIDQLPKDPSEAEGIIREVDEMIKSLPEDTKEKKKLEYSLKKAALLGLSKDLQKVMSSNGLALEGLTLVREYLTTKLDLARFLVNTTDDKVPEAMKMIKRKLGPKLEVLGELANRGYDQSDVRVQKLVELAPSLHELGKVVKSTKKLRELKFDVEERKEIHNLAKADSSVDGGNPASKRKKEERKEKLEKAKELMNQAKKLASENLEKNRKELDEKIKEIKKLVELPSEWNSIDKDLPEQMLEKLKTKIQELDEFKESIPSYDSVEEIVANASGGLALKGIYFSKWEKPQTSNVPILKPPQKVESWNTQSPYETGFRQFSEGHSAEMFSKEVESSGFTHADVVCGFCLTFAAAASGTYGTQTSDESEMSVKTTTTSVSATNFCRSAMKSFAVPRSCLHPTEQACNMALSITERADDKKIMKEEIRRFFKIYGSHVPYGVHQLGGLFFTMSTATSEKEVDTTKLMHLNATKLTTQVSAGFFGGAWGVGGSDMHEYSSSKASSEGSQIENESVHYAFSVKSIGPHADNPASFKKALSTNNATWAILDRGDTAINVPVWELLREEGQKKQDSLVPVLIAM
ncbi:Interferon-induced very large GTPase 1 [Exaiptasia diaphana]|nr:Interferon-induced very large GTPase 1 [Exaiptasia diaphana]